jgi:transcriptional regulator with XRE-family HTH domain
MLENDESAIAVGKRLKRLRLMAGLSRDDLAQEADVGVTSISYWEHAKPDSNPMKPRNVAKILGAIRRRGVDCTERWLLTGAGLPPRLLSGQQVSLIEDDQTPESSTVQLLSSLDNELRLFTSSNPLAVIGSIESSSMLPALESGDIVGGIWQPTNNLTVEKICLVIVNDKLQVRRVKKGSKNGLFNLSFLVYDPNESEPFELKDFPLEKIAPVIRIWRS